MFVFVGPCSAEIEQDSQTTSQVTIVTMPDPALVIDGEVVLAVAIIDVVVVVVVVIPIDVVVVVVAVAVIQ